MLPPELPAVLQDNTNEVSLTVKHADTSFFLAAFFLFFTSVKRQSRQKQEDAGDVTSEA